MKNFFKKKHKNKKIDIATDERFQIERIITLLGLTKISTKIPSNGNILYRCPLCSDSENPSHGHLYIDLINNNYYCAKCGEGGKSLSLYAKTRGIDNKTAFKELLGNVPNKKERKKIYYMKQVKKQIQNNKQDTPPIASINRRDKVYRALLNKLSLSEAHKNNLLKRGLSNEFIKKMGYKTIPQNPKTRNKIAYNLIKQGYKLSGISGFYKDNNNNWIFTGIPGYLIPVLNSKNKIQGFQIRRFVKKGKYIWFSSSGKKEGTPAETFINLAGYDKTKPFVIVEGVLKSQVCFFLKPTANYIGIPGTFAIKFLIDTLLKNNINNVFIAFDMDKLTNQYVEKAEKKLKNTLYSNKIHYQVFNWNIQKGKGLDDYLLNRQIQNNVRQIQNNLDEFIYCG